jgi:elongation factor Ts
MMANYTAADIKALRESTGAGMMDVKRALDEADGDHGKATEILRVKGLKGVTKREGRSATNGLVAAQSGNGVGTLVEVNCETDFVARNAEFTTWVNALSEQIAVDDPSGIGEGEAPLLSQQWKRNPSLTVEQSLGELVTKLGENMGISRFERYELIGDACIGSYVHGVGRIGVLVEIAGAGSDNAAVAGLARDVAMHIAAAAPGWVTSDEVPADVIEHEKSIYMAQGAESGKPEAIQAKIAEGRIAKFFKEVTLTEQPFVKDPDISVGGLVAKVAKEQGLELSLVRFTRWVLGETSDTPAEDCGC